MSTEEQRLADLLKRAVPEPPRELTCEEITVPHVTQSRRSWLMPTLAAAAVVAIGVTVGAVATHHSGPGTASFQPAAGSSPASASPTACAVAVPNVIGMSGAAATAALSAAGLQVVLASQHSSIAPRGMVVSQSPAAGIQVARGSVVRLYVSGSTTTASTIPAVASPTDATCPPSASEPTSRPSVVVLPNVIGQTATQATAALQAAGFSATLQAQAAPASQPVQAGVVWNQTPAGGTAEPPGTTITLFYQPTS